MTYGMTNNQAALLAATTANANRMVSTGDIVTATLTFKKVLDELDQADADTAEKARIQAMPGYCIPHLKDQHANHWGPDSTPLDVRLINHGEQCNTRECFQTDPTNPEPKKATDK